MKVLPKLQLLEAKMYTTKLQNISDNHPLDRSVGTQVIHVNAFRGIVSIRDNNVLSEWDGILDYKNDGFMGGGLFSYCTDEETEDVGGPLRTLKAAEQQNGNLNSALLLELSPYPSRHTCLLVALLAAKLFSKMACVLAKMDQAVFPSFDDISKALVNQASNHYPSTRGLTYTVLPIRVKNLAQYGMAMKDMCRAFPTYFAQQQKKGTALEIDPNSCFEVQLLSFMGLSICGEIPGL
ncbi:Gastrokine-1 [Heterocephalus glaber]|uniref:Gastrokine-1 n=1 Tax=Heterocephalus glaber TaxID=10181 RepID=G5BNY8_HETGA|nr:Gastrokine-1 [Heterocephalus glaber]